MKAHEFDKKFNEGQDISGYLDMSKAVQPGEQLQRINVDFPRWMIQALDKEAKSLGVSRQAVIKFWIAEKLGHYSA